MKRRKIREFAFSVTLVCLLCSGCGVKRGEQQDIPEDVSEIETGIIIECETEQESEATSTQNGSLPPIPKTKEEEEELFGKTTLDGQWIPPEGSYKYPDGNIYNKEGLVIGQWRKPTEKEITNAVG